MTPKIHADPPKFHQVAEDLRRIAEELRQGGSKLLSATADARSYDGQYAPWVQSIASDGDHRTRTLSERIASLAHTLDRIAQAFEEADRLDHSGFSHLADQFRTVIESGYDLSSFPMWLIRGQCPPWIKQELWNRLPLDDRDAILSSVGEDWLGFAGSGDYSHGTDQDIWNAFLVYLYFQGLVFKPPELDVWTSAARASGVDLEVYISEMTGIKQTRFEAWLRAAEAHNFSQEFAIQEMAAMAKAGESIEDHFGFSMEGNWTEEDEDDTVEGILMVSHALARVTPESDTPSEIFREMFGTPTFTLREEGETGTWYCTAGGYGAQCEPLARGRISSELIAHELGHTLNARIANNLGNGLDVHGEDRTEYFRRLQLDPYETLRQSQITAQVEGEETHVSGRNEMGVFERTDHGYASLGPPWQQHSIRWDDNGNTPNEDFADMFLNWAFDGFTDDPAGNARFEWMEENMPDWITFGTETFQETWLNGG
jgi:hypothetical protein